jgi:hypothetical protein
MVCPAYRTKNHKPCDDLIHEGDETVPAGATGTVVHVIKGGGGYDVEFTAPKHVVIPLDATNSLLRD